jgi:hypothetical protein
MERLEGSNDLLDTRNDHNAGVLAELYEQVKVHNYTFFRSVDEALVVNGINNPDHVDGIFGSVIHGLEHLVCSSSDRDSMVVLLLERTQVNFFDELFSHLGVSISHLLELGKLRPEQARDVVDHSRDSFIGVLLDF